MPQIQLDEETIDRLDALRETDETYDDIVNELISVLQTEERFLARYGDEF